MKTAFAFAAILALSACGGGGSPQQNAAQQLEDAAEVSSPEAANVLANGAERIAEGNGANAAGEAQNVLQQAGNAQSK